MDTHLEELQQKFKDLLQKKNELEENARKYKDAINKNYNNLEQQISKMKILEKEMRELKETLQNSSSLKKNQISSLIKEITESSNSIKKLRQDLTPRTGRYYIKTYYFLILVKSLFVRLFLGKVNVKHYRDGERMRLKQEYQKFKK